MDDSEQLGDLIEDLWAEVEDNFEEGPGVVLNKIAKKILAREAKLIAYVARRNPDIALELDKGQHLRKPSRTTLEAVRVVGRA